MAESTQVDRPLPIIDDDNRPFWEGCREHRLVLQRCNSCQAFRYYPGVICPTCGSLDFSWQEVSGKGSIYSFSVVRRPALAVFADMVPYVYAVIELDEGPMMTSNVVGTDVDAVAIGQRVAVDFRDVTDEVTLPVFKVEA